jgi:archaellum component FlaC
MSVKSHVAWVLKGAARTESSLQRLGADLRDLQLKVEALAADVRRIDAELAAGANRAEIARLDRSVEQMREQLRTVTDDLGDRVGSVAQLLNSTR